MRPDLNVYCDLPGWFSVLCIGMNKCVISATEWLVFPGWIAQSHVWWTLVPPAFHSLYKAIHWDSCSQRVTSSTGLLVCLSLHVNGMWDIPWWVIFMWLYLTPWPVEIINIATSIAKLPIYVFCIAKLNGNATAWKYTDVKYIPWK